MNFITHTQIENVWHEPAAPLPGNFSQIFSQEISYFLQEIFVKIVPAKTEVYH